MKKHFLLDDIIPNKAVRVTVKPNRLAKRLILRPDHSNEASLIVTIPTNQYVSKSKITKFVISKKKWISARLRLNRQKEVISFDTNLPILGTYCDIKSISDQSSSDQCSKEAFYQLENTIYISSKNFDTNLKLFLIDRLSAYIDKKIAKLSVKEAIKIKVTITKSKWGTCLRKKDYYQLQFCLFLIFAPTEVIDYVIYHELSHIKYMDHSDRFWKTVSDYCPDYIIRKKWLRINGQELSRYQISK